MYRLKRTVRPGQRVILRNGLKPTGWKIFLDEATQAQLKYLYDEGHPFVELVPDKVEGKTDKVKSGKPEDKKIKIETSGSD